MNSEVLETVKSKATKKRIVTVLKVLGAFFAAIAGGTALLVRRGTKFIKEHGSDQNTMSCTMASCGSCVVAKERKVAALYTLCGCINVSWDEAPDHAVDLDVCSVVGVASVTVPANMRVICDVKAVGGMVNNRTEDPADENAPVLTITGKAILGMITIRSAEDTVADEKE